MDKTPIAMHLQSSLLLRINLKWLAIGPCVMSAMAVLLTSASSALAQANYPTFGQVDYYWAQNPQLFQNLWLAAKTQTVRIAILGDSQETNPGGAGLDYIPRLNYEMWEAVW